MQALGRKILVEFYDCDTELLKTENYIDNAMIEACHEGQATVVSHTFHSFAPLRKWGGGNRRFPRCHSYLPDYGYAAVDILPVVRQSNPGICTMLW
jgi:S-adenosylmethionine/arginine decarboxylase-like enzyme